MKKLFLILILHCARVALLATLFIPSAQDCLSQSITWQKIYHYPSRSDAEGQDVCQADGNNFYIAGFSAPYPPGYRNIYVLKINQWGDTVWTRILGGGEAYGISPSGDGGCVITGEINGAYTIKIKPDGDIAWSHQYSGGSIGFDIIRTMDSGYVICGDKRNGFYTEGYVCKIDSAGNIQWERTYPGNPFVTFQAINIAVEGEGYTVAGIKSISGYNQAFFLKINFNGDTVWQKNYTIGTISKLWSFTKNNSSYILAGTVNNYSVFDSTRVIVIKTDLTGSLTLSKTFISQHLQYIPDIISANNNKFYLSFWTETSNPRKSGNVITSIDTNFNVIKQITLLPDTNDLGLYAISKINNSNDIIGCGTTDNFGGEDVYAVRLDSSLNPPPPIGVKIISSQIPKEFKLYQNYPNPFNTSTVIKYDLLKPGIVKLLLYNILGEKIKKLVNEDQVAGSYSVSFDLNNYSSGVYFYSMETKNFRDSRKMVLIK